MLNSWKQYFWLILIDMFLFYFSTLKFRLDIWKKFFTMRVVRHWKRVTQKSCGCPILGSVQGQVRWGFEQPGLVEVVPAHARGLRTRWSTRSLPTQTMLWFSDSMNDPHSSYLTFNVRYIINELWHDYNLEKIYMLSVRSLGNMSVSRYIHWVYQWIWTI